MKRHLKKRRRWLQFRLRTLLIVMLLTGLGLAYFRPQPEPTRTLADGWKVFAQIQIVMGPNVPDELRYGSYVLRDRAGQRRVVGRYKNDLADDAWTIYHANGRRAMTGKCREGIPIGNWLAWHADGSPAADVAFGVVDALISHSGTSKSKFLVAQPHREGATSFSRNAAGNDVSGQFRHDRAEGDWRTTNGQRSYCQGLRHDDLTTDSSESLFLLGHQVADPQRLLQELAADLDSGNRQQQMSALAMLRVLSIGKVDDAAIMTALDRLAAASDDELAAEAILVSYRLGQPDHTALRALLQRGATSNRAQRIRLAQHLATADEAALAVLEQQLSSTSADDRQYAFQILIVALHHETTFQRANQHRLATLIEIVRRAQDSPDASLRKAATEALQLLEDGELAQL